MSVADVLWTGPVTALGALPDSTFYRDIYAADDIMAAHQTGILEPSNKRRASCAISSGKSVSPSTSSTRSASDGLKNTENVPPRDLRGELGGLLAEAAALRGLSIQLVSTPSALELDVDES